MLRGCVPFIFIDALQREIANRLERVEIRRRSSLGAVGSAGGGDDDTMARNDGRAGSKTATGGCENAGNVGGSCGYESHWGASTAGNGAVTTPLGTGDDRV